VTNVDKLVSLGSSPLARFSGEEPSFLRDFFHGQEIFEMLTKKNGFYAFESALHVFPLMENPSGGLQAWNEFKLWRYEYQDLADGFLFFAEDVFQDQFCISAKQNGIFRFFSETGHTTLLGNSLEDWARIMVTDYSQQTGWPLLHEWQSLNGTRPRGKRLLPKTPFFLGGEYSCENLWAGNSLEGMRFKGDLARQTRDLPEGAKVKLNIGPPPRDPHER
jgi:hypothetical protein